MHFDPKLRKKVQNSIPAIKGTNHRPSRVYVFSNWTLQMHSTGLKRSLFSLLGVKTGGGGKRESFMDILSRGKDTGGAASQRAQEKVSVSGWSAGARCRRSEKQWSCSVPQHTILVFSRGSGGGSWCSSIGAGRKFSNLAISLNFQTPFMYAEHPLLTCSKMWRGKKCVILKGPK